MSLCWAALKGIRQWLSSCKNVPSPKWKAHNVCCGFVGRGPAGRTLLLHCVLVCCEICVYGGGPTHVEFCSEAQVEFELLEWYPFGRLCVEGSLVTWCASKPQAQSKLGRGPKSQEHEQAVKVYLMLYIDPFKGTTKYCVRVWAPLKKTAQGTALVSQQSVCIVIVRIEGPLWSGQGLAAISHLNFVVLHC